MDNNSDNHAHNIYQTLDNRHDNNEIILWSDFVSDQRSFTSDSIITVAEGTTLVFDLDSSNQPIEIGGLLINGRVEFEDSPNANYEISSDWILANNGGHLAIGSHNDKFEGEVTINLTANEGQRFELDANSNSNLSTGEPLSNAQANMLENMIGRNNNNFIMAMGEGSRIDVHADDADKSTWTKLDMPVEGGEGVNTIVVEDAETGWQIGDQIAITSSFYDLNESEEFTIVAIDGNQITLDGEIAHDHIGEVQTYSHQAGDVPGQVKVSDFRANVIRLNSDITIQGDVNYANNRNINEQNDTYGGHIMIMNGADLYMNGAELRYMGQEGELGRYPVHAHQLGESQNGELQFIVENTSIHHSFHKGITIHSSDDSLLDNNVIYETNSQALFLEADSRGQSVNNVNITNNVIANVRDMNNDPDSDPAGIWIEYEGAKIQNNHIKGVDIDTRGHGVVWQNSTDNNPENFSGNTISGTAVAVAGDQGTLGSLLNNEATTYGQYASYNEYGSEGLGNDDFIAIENVQIGWSRIGGWEQRGQGMQITDSLLAETIIGTRFRKDQSLEAVVIGDTGLYDDSDNVTIDGIHFYDGPSTHQITFHNFNGSDDAIVQSNAVEPMLSHAITDVAFVNTDSANKIDFDGGTATLNYKRIGVVDIRGSLTEELISDTISNDSPWDAYEGTINLSRDGNPGGAGATIMPYDERHGTDFYRGENYLIAADTRNNGSYADNGYIINFDVRLGNVVIRDNDSGEYRVTREDGSTLGWSRTTSHQGTVNHGFFLNGEDYKMEFRNEDQTFDLQFLEMPYGSSVIYTLEGLHIATSFTEDPQYSKDNSTNIREVSSMRALRNSPDTAIFRDLDEDVIHVKIVADASVAWLNANPSVTYDDELLTGYIINVDQRANSRIDINNIDYDNPGSDDSAAQTFSGTQNSDLYYGFNQDDLIEGNGGNDELYGGIGDDLLEGGSGNDKLFGNSGNDELRGQQGNDILYGNSGEDDLYGGDGSDVLDGGAGRDRLNGGNGSDTFVLSIDKTFGSTSSLDVIQDFELGVDKIDIKPILSSRDSSLTENGIYNSVLLQNTNNGRILLVDPLGNGDFQEFADIRGADFTLQDLIKSGSLVYGNVDNAGDGNNTGDGNNAGAGSNAADGNNTGDDNNSGDDNNDGGDKNAGADSKAADANNAGDDDIYNGSSNNVGRYVIYDENNNQIELQDEQSIILSSIDEGFLLEAYFDGNNNQINNAEVDSVRITISQDGQSIIERIENRSDWELSSERYDNFNFTGGESYDIQFASYDGGNGTGNLLEVSTSTINVIDDVNNTPSDNNPEQVIMEFGSFSMDHTGTTVNLEHSFIDPVVFVTMTSFNGSQFAAPRITDIQNDSFELYLQEPEYLDGWHTVENFSYIVAEKGSWELSDGTKLEVGSLDTNVLSVNGFEEVAYTTDFEDGPSVMTQVQTNNDTDFVATRQSNSDVNGFDVALQEEELYNSGSHDPETIGWLAIETGAGNSDGHDFIAGSTSEDIKHSFSDVLFDDALDELPQLIANISSHNGPDAAVVRIDNLDANGFDTKVQEDQSQDDEVRHARETIDYFAIEGSGTLIGTQNTDIV